MSDQFNMSVFKQRAQYIQAKEAIENAAADINDIKTITKGLDDAKYNVDEMSDNPKTKKHLAEAFGKVKFALNNLDKIPSADRMIVLIDGTLDYLKAFARNNGYTKQACMALISARSIFSNL